MEVNMSLRNQPYLPLYVQDFLTDEKLIECSALATGVYIRLMCIMHKSDEYGTILLKQKDKQNTQQILNFAAKLAKHMPYPEVEIIAGLTELLNEGVLQIEGDVLSQKRMVKDNNLSEKRSDAGKKGGFASSFAKANIQANSQANSESESEDEIDFNSVTDNESKQNKNNSFVEKFNEIRKTKYRGSEPKFKRQYSARIKEGYTDDDLLLAYRNLMKLKIHIDSNFQYLTPEFITRSDILERSLNQQPPPPPVKVPTICR
jgi:uncharacterized protein YdaU (DUF1376 family)